MKENLTIQFVYPNYPLPSEYDDAIETIDHVKIKPYQCVAEGSDIIIIDKLADIDLEAISANGTYVIRITKQDFFSGIDIVSRIIKKVTRLNLILTDIETFTVNDFDAYQNSLQKIGEDIEKLYFAEGSPQFNLLTDRLLLKQMNNCNAGDSNITLAPDGCFYPCPAFYYEKPESPFMGLGGPKESPLSIGNLKEGLLIKNSQLYKLTHAPLCRICDSFQCKRCVWLNWKMTKEINTPSHEQCVIAHIERNVSRQILEDVRKYGEFLPDQNIKEIGYLDPFDVKEEW